MGPQDGYQWTTQISSPPSQDQINDVYKGTLGLFVVGCIGYRDDLGNSYTTPICQVYVPNANNASNSFGLFTLQRGKPQSNAQPHSVPVEPD
jgi:hypothetical protein